MKRVVFGSVVVICSVVIWAFLVHTAWSQPDVIAAILGQGTANFVPEFTDPHHIGDSVIFQDAGGNVGIGTTSPDAKLGVNQTGSASGTNSGIFALDAGATGSAAGENSSLRAIRGFTTGNATGVNSDIAAVVARSDGNATGFNSEVVGLRGVVNGTPTAPDADVVGVVGVANATSGFAVGVRGRTNSPDGVAVIGRANAPGGEGVRGINLTCDSLGIVCTPTTGIAVHAITGSGGTLLLGTNASFGINVFRVDSIGTVFADGGFQPSGADFAEALPVTGDRSKYEPGDLLVIDPKGKSRLGLTHQVYSTLVAGIFSTKPGVLGTTRRLGEPSRTDEVPLAVVGIVPCKVTAENGPIAVGDLLVTSSTPGHAMKGTDRARMLGAVVGKALEPLKEGTGMIQVLVTLQ